MGYSPQGHRWVPEPLWVELGVGELVDGRTDFGMAHPTRAAPECQVLGGGGPGGDPRSHRDEGWESCEAVKELMGEESGKRARDRASELGKLAKGAVQVGGSSYKCLNELIDQLRQVNIHRN